LIQRGCARSLLSSKKPQGNEVGLEQLLDLLGSYYPNGGLTDSPRDLVQRTFPVQLLSDPVEQLG
jgi:hypothetical protein